MSCKAKCTLCVYGQSSFPQACRRDRDKSFILQESPMNICMPMFQGICTLKDVTSSLTSSLFLVDYPSSYIYSKEK